MAAYNTFSLSAFVVDIGNLKFARGARFSQMEAQERYKEECQRVFDLQNTSVTLLYWYIGGMNNGNAECYRALKFYQRMRRAATVGETVMKNSAGT